MAVTSERWVSPHQGQSLVAACPRWCKALPDSRIESDRGRHRVGPALSRQKTHDPADCRCQVHRHLSSSKLLRLPQRQQVPPVDPSWRLLPNVFSCRRKGPSCVQLHSAVRDINDALASCSTNPAAAGLCHPTGRARSETAPGATLCLAVHLYCITRKRLSIRDGVWQCRVLVGRLRPDSGGLAFRSLDIQARQVSACWQNRHGVTASALSISRQTET